jgi:hypothetical protein
MAAQQWYMARRGCRIGPVAEAEAIPNVRNCSVDANTYGFGSGMSSWTRLKDLPLFAAELGRKTLSPMLPGRTAHELDFEISGTEMQFVEVELDPDWSTVAEAGSMMDPRDRDGDSLRRRQSKAALRHHWGLAGREFRPRQGIRSREPHRRPLDPAQRSGTMISPL